MSKVYVTEYAALPSTPAAIMVAPEPPLASQVIDFSGGVASITLGSQTRYVRLQNDAICSMSFTSTNAATTDARSPADTIEYKGVQPGSKISAIANT